MVRPYLPRFLREGDRAELKVVVNNATDAAALRRAGPRDPRPGDRPEPARRLRPRPRDGPAAFTVAAGGGADLTFPVTAPRQVGTVAFQVTAVAGAPVGRRAAAAAGAAAAPPPRPVALRRAPGRRTRILRFADLERGDDPSPIDEQIVVTLDAQLFHSALAASPLS